ncbi:ABC transporter ATP-binding protein [Caenibacillus caldisaponilyticus]|uniref:ABC transporter ATP-binding protein n=1 Tax=Caenibacillus caldisaponilyticus TaxID=1674942 RepID=UPI001EE7483B|nr:ABC transporter ATP-binding protein [Caenibacillus caldisaponilyticus]
MSAVVEVRQLTKRIKGKEIVKDLTFDIHSGEVLGFLGPNGAGKTTTMRMMLGLMSMSEGDCLINGYSVKTRKEEALQYVGGIVENPEMYKFLSGYDNLMHYKRMHPNVSEDRLHQVTALVGLTDAIKRKVKTYSLGMRQRLGIAQALLHNPKVLILDEPTNGLDPAGIRELRDYLRKLAKEEGLAIFISSHLLSEVELICDRVLILQKGQIIDSQSVREPEAEILEIAFEVDKLEEAAALLRSSLPDIAVKTHGEQLVVEAEREAIPAVNRRLVENGIGVYGIQTVRKSLEERFLEATGGRAE